MGINVQGSCYVSIGKRKRYKLKKNWTRTKTKLQELLSAGLIGIVLAGQLQLQIQEFIHLTCFLLPLNEKKNSLTHSLRQASVKTPWCIRGSCFEWSCSHTFSVTIFIWMLFERLYWITLIARIIHFLLSFAANPSLCCVQYDTSVRFCTADTDAALISHTIKPPALKWQSLSR